jgi:hypothetical protein
MESASSQTCHVEAGVRVEVGVGMGVEVGIGAGVGIEVGVEVGVGWGCENHTMTPQDLTEILINRVPR